MKTKIISDKLILRPKDIKYHPVQKQTGEPTEIIGVFNPAMVRLKNSILLVARVAESFYTKKGAQTKKSPIFDPKQKKFIAEEFSNIKKFKNLRVFHVKDHGTTRVAFTSWLLPIELDPETLEIKKIHYKKAILPKRKLQEFGIEDPRITRIKNKLYMTVVGYSKRKICTYLYQLNEKTLKTRLKGLIFEHQNKDVVLFPKKINNRYIALTRPAPPFINLAYSKDLLYWKPSEFIIARIKSNTKINEKLGAGSPPVSVKINDKYYWLQLIHGVERIEKEPKKHKIHPGHYRTYVLLLNRTKPYKVFKFYKKPILEANPELGKLIKKPYIKHGKVVFTTGLIKYKDHYLLASGELDTAIRLTEMDIKF